MKTEPSGGYFRVRECLFRFPEFTGFAMLPKAGIPAMKPGVNSGPGSGFGSLGGATGSRATSHESPPENGSDYTDLGW